MPEGDDMMRHPATVIGVVAFTTLILDMMMLYLRRDRSWRRSLWVAAVASGVWIVIAGVWRNLHVDDFPARYSIWFNFALPALPALLGAITGVVASIIIQEFGARRTGP
jgi:hypothetical protein